MSYIRKNIYLRDKEIIIVKKMFSLRYGRKAARGINIKKTSEKQKDINRRRAEENRMYTLVNNFDIGDWWITLTYSRDKRPESVDDAHKLFTKYLAKLRRKYGDKLKYMGKTELPERGAVHHHLVIAAGVPLDDVMKLWKWGRIKDVKAIYSINDFELAAYFVKNEKSHKCIECKYTQSRNLVKPTVKTEVVSAVKWRKNPQPLKGYDIAGDVKEYIDEIGFPVQSYFMIRRKGNKNGSNKKNERGRVPANDNRNARRRN